MENKLGFIQLVKNTLQILGKNWLSFVKLTLVLMLPVVIFMGLFSPWFFDSQQILLSVWIIPLEIYYYFVVIPHIRLTILVNKGKKVDLLSIIKWSFKRLGSYIMLSLRTLIYIGWPMIVAGLLYVLYVLYLLVFEGSMFVGGDSIGIALGIVLGMFGIFALIFAIIKMPRVVFGYYVIAEKECSSKEALNTSITASRGNWWKIVGNGLLFVIIFGIASGILNELFGIIHVVAENASIILLWFIIQYIGFIFYYGLYNLCKKRSSKK